MEVNDIYITQIIRQNNEGFGVAKINNFTVFVPFALQDEKVIVKITEIKKNYATANLEEVIESSIDRRIPLCPYFYECGGCNLMHQSYESQLEFKRNKINSIFKKICNIDINLDEIKSYNSLNYRNKVVFKVDKDKIGFYKPKTNDLVDIAECKISDDKINNCLKDIRSFIKENENNNISEVMIRVCNDELMLSIDKLKESLYDRFIGLFSKKVHSIYINKKLKYGTPNLNQKMNNLVFDVSPKSFFQVNIKTAENLYKEALKNVKEENITVDLYSGTGTITAILSKNSRRVIGIESVVSAVRDAKNNMILNNIDNVEFKCGKVEDLIDDIKDLNIDVLIMDPPRGGSDKKTLKSIIDISPKELVYISCNPVTLARDYNILKEAYEIEKITGFDMFPNTYHVECVCVLNRR